MEVMDNNLQSLGLRASPNPFMIDMILHELFDVVDYETLQQCRLVCTKWYSLSNPNFIKRSMICFQNNAQLSRHPSNLKELFHSYYPFPIKAYQFKNDTWPAAILEDFCKQRTKNVHDLRLVNIRLSDANFASIRTYDVSSLIFPRLKKLVIDCSEERLCTMFYVSSNSLLRVEDLNFRRCAINISPNPTKLNPKKINFCQLYFFHNRQEVRTLLLNSIVDFRKIEDVQIFKTIGRTLKIDLGLGEAKIKSLYLDDITCTNSRKSIWDVKKLTLHHIRFDEKTLMANIVELSVTSNFYFDFALLPSTIQKLSLDNLLLGLNQTYPILNKVLPRLKFLCLKFDTSTSSFPDKLHKTFRMFTDCDTLKDIELYSNAEKFHVNDIPKNVETMKLVGAINVFGEGFRHLNSLVLHYPALGSVRSLNTTLTKLVSKYISVVLQKQWPLSIVRILSDKEFVIGECIWEGGDELEQSSFLEYVDAPAKYYFFKNGTGKAMTEEEFFNYSKRR